MNREFLLNIIFLLFINLLIKPFYIFGIDLAVQNRVEAGAYGLYFALFNLTLLFQIINDLGIQYFNNRSIAQHNHLLDKYFPKILFLKGLLGIVYIVVILLVAWMWGYRLSVYPLLLPIVFNQLLSALILFFRSNISGLAMYRLDSVLSVLDRLLLILICSALLWGHPFGEKFKIEWFVYAQTVSLCTTATIAFLIIKSKIVQFQLRFQPAFILMLLKQSFPYAMAVFLMAAYTRLDGVLVERLLPTGKIEADRYAAAYRLLDAASMIGFLFAGLLLPMFARMLKEKQPLTSLVQFSFQLIWVGAFALAAAVIAFRMEIMTLLYHNGDAYSGDIMGFLMLGFLAMCVIYIFGPLLTANGNLKQMNRIFVVGFLLNISLNLLLIPSYKALGAAAVACTTQFFVAIAEIILAKKEIKLSFDRQWIIQIIGFSVLSGLTALWIHQNSTLPWHLGFLLIMGSCLLWALIFKLLQWKNLQGIFVNTK